MLTPPTNRSATRLQFFVQNWKQITQDTWTLQTIQGYKIPLYRRPRQWRMRVTRIKCPSDAHHMEMAIKDLLSKGAVREVQPQDDQFTSTLFLVQKENGDYRPIINLRALNRFLEKESFKMEGLQVVKSLIQQGDFMMKLDLKDAYYAIPIHHSHRKYLRFIYQDRTYEFQCLPFGLSSAPRAFTKTLKPVLAVLRSMGIRVVIYIDDMLLLHQQSKVLQEIFAQVVDLLEKLGFLVKREKCSPIPCQHLIFLGAALDSTTMTLCLPQPKLTSIVDTCHHLLTQGNGSVRTLSTLIGQMSHASQTGILVAPLHYRGLQRLYLQAVSQHGQARKVIVPLTSQALKDLEWWVSESSCRLNGCPIQLPPIDLTVWSDASKKGLGRSLPGDFHRGPLECGRGAVAHQCLGATSSNTGSESTSAVPRVSTSSAQTHSLENRQHHSGGVHQQERGHALPCPDCTSPRIVGSCLVSRSITDSSAYSRHSKCGSRHSLQADRDQNRMDIGQEDLPVHLSEILHARSRPLCIPLKPPSTQVCLEVPRSRGSGCGCISLGLEQMDLSHPPSGSPSASGTEEDQRGSSNCRPPNCPELDRTAMVSRPHSDAGGSPTAATTAPISVVSPISANSVPSSVEVPSSDSLATIRDRYQATGLSKEVVDILLASWGTATQKRYSAPWRAWVRWCSQQGSCPISAPVAEVLAFLTSLVTQGKLEYRTIALYRSAISQAHDPVGSTQLGSLPVVARFMKGVFKIKPPKPRYCSTWNVKTALSFLESLEPLEELTLKQLCYKTVLLLALTSAARAHELSALDLTYSLRKEGSWEFSLPTHVKNSRPGHPARKFIFLAFPENPKICVIRSLIAYVDRTKGLRKSTQLLVSFISPHKAISSQSVSRWLSRALRMAGIELKYTGHSTRGASTSAAAAAGLSADLILEAADWASVQTFERFYHRESSAGAFARAVLNG